MLGCWGSVYQILGGSIDVEREDGGSGGGVK